MSCPRSHSKMQQLDGSSLAGICARTPDNCAYLSLTYSTNIQGCFRSGSTVLEAEWRCLAALVKENLKAQLSSLSLPLLPKVALQALQGTIELHRTQFEKPRLRLPGRASYRGYFMLSLPFQYFLPEAACLFNLGITS